jgi:hypothetical protein
VPVRCVLPKRFLAALVQAELYYDGAWWMDDDVCVHDQGPQSHVWHIGRMCAAEHSVQTQVVVIVCESRKNTSPHGFGLK